MKYILRVTAVVLSFILAGAISAQDMQIEDQDNPKLEFYASPSNVGNPNSFIRVGYLDWFDGQNNSNDVRLGNSGTTNGDVKLQTLRTTQTINELSLSGGNFNVASSVPVFFVDGSANGKMFLYPDGDLCINGNLSCPSDRRLKKNIIPLKSALASISNLGGYRFNWIDQEKRGSQVELGLIAQEVRAEFPELIRETEGGDLSVNYDGMVPVLVQAIKEQQVMLEQLQATVKTMQVAELTENAKRSNIGQE